MMSEIKDPSVAVYEVNIVCVILLLFVCMHFVLFLPSSYRVVPKMSISVHKINTCWCLFNRLSRDNL